MSERTTFLDIGFDRLTEDALVAQLRARGDNAPFAYVVTPNVDHVVRLSARPAGAPEHRVYAQAAWCVCDSRILGRLARMRGVDLPVTPGSDLTARIVQDVLVAGDRVCIIGGDAATGQALAAIRPDIVLFQHVPPMGLASDPAARAAAARFAAETQARFTLIAVGSPQQELIAQAIAALPGATGIGLCIGASIDFLTGRTRRAPRWMQRLSIEWLHRLASDPARLWRRYLVEGPRVFLLAWRWKK